MNNKNFYTNWNLGFTLIELLVVISIIGLLSSIVLVSLNGAREKARVTKTKAELKQFYTALEMYYNDNSTFPCFNEGAASACLIPALAPYGKFPAKDPWGQDYSWHNPGCCTTECTMVVSNGPDKLATDGTNWINLEHVPSQTNNCTQTNSSYDDMGMYFGAVKDHL